MTAGESFGPMVTLVPRDISGSTTLLADVLIDGIAVNHLAALSDWYSALVDYLVLAYVLIALALNLNANERSAGNFLSLLQCSAPHKVTLLVEMHPTIKVLSKGVRW